MDNNFEVRISGVKDLVERMRSLPAKLQKRGMKRAVRAGAEKIAEAARANAMQLDDPATAERIAANIAVQFAPRMSRAQGGIAYRVGVLGGAKNPTNAQFALPVPEGSVLPGGDTWYWRLLEFGTSKIEARAFMRQAIDQAAEYASEEVATILEQELDKAVREPTSIPKGWEKI